jgi:hypothetical protein
MESSDSINVRRFINIASRKLEPSKLAPNCALALQMLATLPDDPALTLELTRLIQSTARTHTKVKSPHVGQTEITSDNSPLEIESFRDYLIKLPTINRSSSQTSVTITNTTNADTQKSLNNLTAREQLLGKPQLSHTNQDENEAELLRKDKKVQEELTAKLIEQVVRLRGTSIELKDSIEMDKDILLDNSMMMDQNQISIDKERKRIQQVSSGSWNTTFMIWGSLLGVLVVFLAMFMYIRMFGSKRVLGFLSTKLNDEFSELHNEDLGYIPTATNTPEYIEAWDEDW